MPPSGPPVRVNRDEYPCCQGCRRFASTYMNRVNPVRRMLARSLVQLPFLDAMARRVLRAGGPVFMLHRVLPKGEDCYEPEMVTAKEAFADFLDWLTENYQVVPLDVLVALRGKSSDGRKPICAITFDDGWRDNFTHAFPLLQARGLPATIFLPVCFIGTNRHFWQERLWFCVREINKLPSAPDLLEESVRRFPCFAPDQKIASSYGSLKNFLLTRASAEAEEFVEQLASIARVDGNSERAFLNWDEVRLMQESGISYGSHTLHHVLLTGAAPRAMNDEIRQSRQELAERLKTDISGFSYPWGSSNAVSRLQVENSGYRFAVTTEPELVTADTNPWLIPRFAVSSNVLSSTSQDFAHRKAVLSFAKGIFQSRLHGRKAKKVSLPPGRIRIAFIIDQIDGWKGGTESQLHTLIQQLDRDYFEPELICIFPFASVPPESFPCRVHFVCPDDGSSPNPFLRMLRMVKLIRQLKPHLVQTYFPEGNTLGLCSAWLARVPLIVGTTRNSAAPRGLQNLMLYCTQKIADRWQCNSRAIWRAETGRHGRASAKIEIAPNAIDLARFSPFAPDLRDGIRHKLGLTTPGPVIVSVANPRPVKDLATLIKAARYVTDELPNARFLVVGEGPLYDQLQQQIRESDLTAAVTLAGGQVDVVPYLASADIAVLTSLSEGSSNSLIEYMAMGIPTVVSDIPANRELVEGVFFNPGDALDLARKLIDLWKDPVLARRLSARHRDAICSCSLDACTRRAEGFYNRLVSEIQ
jgi:glycosyltransferase involved in cell wall biosynthesis/peptidoglycan/xylan/chitin deacetylase (PgdA/CDA1 family)